MSIKLASIQPTDFMEGTGLALDTRLIKHWQVKNRICRRATTRGRAKGLLIPSRLEESLLPFWKTQHSLLCAVALHPFHFLLLPQSLVPRCFQCFRLFHFLLLHQSLVPRCFQCFHLFHFLLSPQPRVPRCFQCFLLFHFLHLADPDHP